MRIIDRGNSIYVSISPDETRDWARSWPCSVLKGKRVQAWFDRSGLFDIRINYGRSSSDVDAHEFNALVCDALDKWGLTDEHECWFVTVGQFK
ncbi:MAG: hypothetical protein ACO3O3_11490 [Ilumatobacteraceae bacterium]